MYLLSCVSVLTVNPNHDKVSHDLNKSGPMQSECFQKKRDRKRDQHDIGIDNPIHPGTHAGKQLTQYWVGKLQLKPH